MSDSTEIALLRQEVAELKTLVGELVQAWNTARGVVKFVKVLSTTVAAVSAAVAGVWALFHLGGTK